VEVEQHRRTRSVGVADPRPGGGGAVRVVRKTEDIAGPLIAIAAGALVTLGPLALLQSV
jgi:hypothetical protein